MRDLYVLLLFIYDLEFTEALVIMSKNKYSSFIVELAQQFFVYSSKTSAVTWMELLVTKGSCLHRKYNGI